MGRSLRGGCGVVARRQSASGQNIDGLIDRNPHHALWLIHPAVAVEHLIFLGADGPEIEHRSLLQLWLRKQLGGLDGRRVAGLFARLEESEQPEQQSQRDDRTINISAMANLPTAQTLMSVVSWPDPGV